MPLRINKPCNDPFYCRGEHVCRLGGAAYSADELQACIDSDLRGWNCKSDAECAALDDDEDALSCFLERAGCMARGCDRSLTDCYRDALKARIQEIYDDDATFNARIAAATEANNRCQDRVETARTDCLDAAAGDPDREQDCNDVATTAGYACARTFSKAQVESARGVNDEDFVEGYSECDATESDRTDADRGIDARKRRCLAGSLRCRKPCRDAWSASVEGVQNTYLSALNACYDLDESGSGSGPEFISCTYRALVARDVALAPIQNAYQLCLGECCLKHEKSKLDGSGAYDRQWLTCDAGYRTCMAPWQNTEPGNEDTVNDAITGCGTALDSCRSAIQGFKPCLNCGDPESSLHDPFVGKSSVSAELQRFLVQRF